MHYVGPAHSRATAADRLAALLRAQRELHVLGITAWQDALVGAFVGMEDPSDAYLTAARDGSLTARVVGALWWDRERGAEQIPELVERRAAFSHGRFRADSVKLMLDGVAENGTAALLDPIWTGAAAPPQIGEELHRSGSTSVVRHRVGRARLPVSLPRAGRPGRTRRPGRRGGGTEGQRAKRHPSAPRPSPGGAPDDVPRFARLGATANIQPLWAAHEPQMDELTLPFLGPERASWQYPFGALLRSGRGSPRAATGRSAAPTRFRASTSRSTGWPRTGPGRCSCRTSAST